MNKPESVIRILPESVVAQIAAGEVVERPTSVVKELMENSIDAQSRLIEIEIKEGGHKLIEISDDGIGMSQQDAVLAFTQHATSKISAFDDLIKLRSLGFRGEALASIASVSRVTLVTRREDLTVGTRVQIEGGHIRLVENASHPKGTRIQIKNIFFNVPARKKFLKSQQAEMAQISDMVCHYILGYPELSFRFSRGNVPVVSSNGSGNLMDAILAVYGPEIAKGLVPLKESPSFTGTGITLNGFISSPNDPRPSGRYMTILVNRRYIKSKIVAAAVSKALSSFFPKGKFPVLIMDMRIPGDLVDVNVHPQKTEVRFRDERGIFALVYESIKTSLSGLKLSNPVMLHAENEENFQTASFSSLDSEEEGSSAPSGTQPFNRTIQLSHPTDGEKTYQMKEETITSSLPKPSGSSFEPVQTLNSPKILAQLSNTYILGEDREGMFIIDQHAAHERILFDTYVETYRDIRVNTQQLLFPIPLNLLPSERMLVKEHSNQLRDLGFAIHQEDDGQFYATSIPIVGERSNDEGVIQELLSQVVGDWETRSIDEIKIDLLKTMACRAAVKAGDSLKDTEMRSLFEQLLKTKNPYTCPHGRPIVLRLSLSQIEHGFLRT